MKPKKFSIITAANKRRFMLIEYKAYYNNMQYGLYEYAQNVLTYIGLISCPIVKLPYKTAYVLAYGVYCSQLDSSTQLTYNKLIKLYRRLEKAIESGEGDLWQ